MTVVIVVARNCNALQLQTRCDATCKGSWYWGLCYLVLSSHLPSTEQLLLPLTVGVNSKGSKRSTYAPKMFVSSSVVAKALMLMLEDQIVFGGQSGGYRWVGSISVEHVLPRNMRNKHADWEQKGWTQPKHEQWLHRLGNLALLNDSDNSSLGNLGFDRKSAKVAELRQKHMLPWSLEDVYTKHKIWDEANLQARHSRLLEIFRKRWALPTAAAAKQGPSMPLVCKGCLCCCCIYMPLVCPIS